LAKRVLVIGANGALGADLMNALEKPVAAVHADFDICDKKAAHAFIAKAGVDAVINTAAYHQVPLCETEWARAFEVNAQGARALAEVCGDLGVHLCHISTDYVFDGRKGAPYVEEDLPAPLSMYAISKLAGEHAVAAYCADSAIVRSSGLYGKTPTRAKGGNFINAMIKLGTERDLVTVVDDEIVCPTYTHDLARALSALIEAGGKGLFHIVQDGETTWHDFAQVIFETKKLPAKLRPISAKDFQSTVQRPAYSILSNAKFEGLTGFRMPHWKDALLRHLAEI